MDRVDYQELVIQDLLNLHKREELNLTPWYQRRSVWKPTQQSYLINTLFEHKPIPSLYVRHSLDLQKEKSLREVVDGQQRIRSVLDFVDNKLKAQHPRHDEPVTYEHLTASQRGEFLMTKLSVGYLINATDEDVIEIFGRLNSVAKTLNLQEKRNARFSGAFKRYCLTEAASRVALWRELSIFTATDISRMNEVQFVAELCINMIEGLVDYSTKQIDDYYERFDDQFKRGKALAKRMEATFALIASLSPTTIKDTIFSRAPLFFTLFLILDSRKNRISATKLESALPKIDAIFNSETPVNDRKKADAAFYFALASNPHRIRSRKVRDTYVRSFLG